MSPVTPFVSLAALERSFADGLAAMLDTHRGLGVYILVLANAAYDPMLWAALAPALEQRHAELATTLVERLRRGQTLAEPEDDVMVFLKLHAIGFEHLGKMESRRAGPWEVMFNPIRALRPPRASGIKFESLTRPFDPDGFHFNKPFLAKEILWEGELAGKPTRVLYNKFPFARLHGLLVPEPQRERSQCLTPELHQWAWTAATTADVPGLCLAYNSMGAGASVNHLHFQSFVQHQALPVQRSDFAHNGGDVRYPLPCLRLEDAGQAWLALDRLHQANTPYNLIYGKFALHLIPRVPQDSAALEARSHGYGWSEMAGALTLFSRQTYETLNATEFEATLARFAPTSG